MNQAVYSIDDSGRPCIDEVLTHNVDAFVAEYCQHAPYLVTDWDAQAEQMMVMSMDCMHDAIRALLKGAPTPRLQVVINEHKPRKPVPACPPEVWAAPAAGVDYMAAVRAMCKGDAK